ncbi:uncharacterized protein K02A2.6-like [Ornithodoros turicata]|uniref:uncharacterized protein K02A2.6-like n=1 Tax=Ornithodoros turicata TaxID=34597 RepID=UPI0031395749
MKAIARSHVWWDSIDDDITATLRSCRVCQEQQTASRCVPLTPWPLPERPWSRLHVDYADPFKSRYYLVVVDAYSKWMSCQMDVIGGVIRSTSAVILGLSWVNTHLTNKGPEVYPHRRLGPLLSRVAANVLGSEHHNSNNNKTEEFKANGSQRQLDPSLDSKLPSVRVRSV